MMIRLVEYSTDFISIANRTSRSSGSSAIDSNGHIRSVVAKYVIGTCSKDDSILDFGAGRDAVQTMVLRTQGFTDITAYDFGANVKEGLHDPQALSRQYKIVFASNVINVSSDANMVYNTMTEIWGAVQRGGRCIFNYPSSPRKANLSTDEVAEIVRQVTKVVPTVVSGNKSAPVWEVKK